MLNEPMDVLKAHPIRKSKEQKEAFRADVQSYAQELGYAVKVEEGSFKSKNILFGNPKTAKYLVTAHYDTPASIGLPNILTPCNLLTYLIWQFLIVGVLLAMTFVLGFVTYRLTHSREIVMPVCYLFYFGFLVLLSVGPANKNNANDNTSGVVTVLEIARSLDKIHRDKVCFVLFDLEEAGLIGSASYRKAHKAESENQIVLNLDCVGDGDHIIFFPTKKAKKNEKLMKAIHHVGGWFGKKNIFLKNKGFYIYPSDQKNFPQGVGIAAFHKKKGSGYYVDKIHTKKDVNLDITNVNLLRAALTTIICGDAVN
jgi:hypothetical protein